MLASFGGPIGAAIVLTWTAYDIVQVAQQVYHNKRKSGKPKRQGREHKGRPGNNKKQNKQVKDAGREAGLNKEQTEKLGLEVEDLSRNYGENLGYKDILDMASRKQF